jgi:hypothetical protein
MVVDAHQIVRGFYGQPGFAVEQADLNGNCRLGVKAGAKNGGTQERDESAESWHIGVAPMKDNRRSFDSSRHAGTRSG